jgi:hypothetical protein
MKKRVLIAVALVLAIVLIAQTGAWASKLQVANEAPAASEAGARPQGTVKNTGGAAAPAVPATGAEEEVVTVTDYTGEAPEGAPDGAALYQVTVTKGGQKSGDTFAKAQTIEVELGPNGGTVSYWNGSAWVDLTVSDAGTVTLPVGAPNPAIIAVVSK